jgi:segregation and condensation protein A
METIGYYFKEPDKDFSDYKVVYKDFNVDALLKAFANLLLKNESMQREKDNIKEIPKDEYTVEEKVTFIKDKLLQTPEFEFDSLFKTYSKNEVITTFQALLEMLKFQYVCVEQDSAFGTIKIKVNPDADLKEVGSEQFDEYN